MSTDYLKISTSPRTSSAMAAFSSWLCSHGAKAKLVRIVHPCGHVELHDGPVRAAEIMLRNPTFCLTHSHASQQPWAIVAPDTTLMAGRKYYLSPESSVGKLQKRPAAQASEASEKENGNLGSACFNGGNCIMCLVDGIKIRKENERGEGIMGPEISCRSSECCERLEGKRVKRRGVFAENGNIRGSPNRQFASSDNWQPSLNSITEE